MDDKEVLDELVSNLEEIFEDMRDPDHREQMIVDTYCIGLKINASKADMLDLLAESVPGVTTNEILHVLGGVVPHSSHYFTDDVCERLDLLIKKASADDPFLKAGLLKAGNGRPN
jgi:hypothetical protein